MHYVENMGHFKNEKQRRSLESFTPYVFHFNKSTKKEKQWVSSDSSEHPYAFLFLYQIFNYIPIGGCPIGIAGVSSLIVDTTDSVVRSVLATLVAF